MARQATVAAGIAGALVAFGLVAHALLPRYESHPTGLVVDRWTGEERFVPAPAPTPEEIARRAFVDQLMADAVEEADRARLIDRIATRRRALEAEGQVPPRDSTRP